MSNWRENAPLAKKWVYMAHPSAWRRSEVFRPKSKGVRGNVALRRTEQPQIKHTAVFFVFTSNYCLCFPSWKLSKVSNISREASCCFRNFPYYIYQTFFRLQGQIWCLIMKKIIQANITIPVRKQRWSRSVPAAVKTIIKKIL